MRYFYQELHFKKEVEYYVVRLPLLSPWLSDHEPPYEEYDESDRLRVWI